MLYARAFSHCQIAQHARAGKWGVTLWPAGGRKILQKISLRAQLRAIEFQP
jgi:hypothetical protein